MIARSLEAGVIRIVDVGTKLDTSRAAVEGAHKYPAVYASAGFHPHDSEVADEAGMKVVQVLLEASDQMDAGYLVVEHLCTRPWGYQVLQPLWYRPPNFRPKELQTTVALRDCSRPGTPVSECSS